MSVFEQISSVYDRGMRPLELLIFRRLRHRTFPQVEGRVLELGVGTGVNLPLYGPDARVTGCDASEEMLSWAAQRCQQGCEALVQADVQHLPFADGSFDVVAGSLLFCIVPDPGRGLSEARRVLGAEGRLVLLEHTRGSGLGAFLTDLLNPLWHACSRDCHLNRETVRTVEEAGFELQGVEQHLLGVVRLIEAMVRRD